MATRILSKANKLLANCTTYLTHLAKLKLSLEENLSVLKQLDDEILDLVGKGTRADEIEQVDAFKKDLYGVI